MPSSRRKKDPIVYSCVSEDGGKVRLALHPVIDSKNGDKGKFRVDGKLIRVAFSFAESRWDSVRQSYEQPRVFESCRGRSTKNERDGYEKLVAMEEQGDLVPWLLAGED